MEINTIGKLVATGIVAGIFCYLYITRVVDFGIALIGFLLSLIVIWRIKL